MKYPILLILFLTTVGASISAQDFEIDPSNGTHTLKVGSDILYMLQLLSPNGMPLHAQLTLNNDESSKTTINDAGLIVNSKNSDVYSITRQAGFQAYDDNGNMTVQIRGDVGGDGRVSTNELEITGGSDFSENFDIIDHKTAVIEPGMLVSITGENGKLSLSTSKRDKKVVGIISGANGIETGMIMGQKGSIADGDYPIALSGRTYVNVNTENGPIKPGDFITTSSTPGYGMKVKKYKKAQGAIVGKAMTSLDSGSGYVLVLVNLQ